MYPRNPVGMRNDSLWRSAFIAAPIALLLAVTVACGASVDETIDRAFVTGAEPRLEIYNHNGPIQLKVGASDTLRFEAEITRSEFLSYELRQDGNTVIFESELTPEFTTGDTPKVDIVVTLPADTVLTINTGNGRIEVEGLQGPGSLNTGNGDMTFEDTQGDFTGNTGNGNLKVSDATGSVVLNSGNGKIVLNRVSGDFKMSTGNGAVSLDDVEGSISADSGNGDIKFNGALAPGSSNNLATGNGRVEVETLCLC